MQARKSEWDDRLYNINRDFAHCFDRIAMATAGRLEDEAWPIVAQVMKEHNVTMDQLGDACQAACLFVRTSTQNPKESMEDALRRCGWFDVPEAAQMAYMAVMGTAVFGLFFNGVREATMGGVGPTMTYLDIEKAARLSAQTLSMSKTQRWLRKLKYRFSNALSALRGVPPATAISLQQPTGIFPAPPVKTEAK